MQYTVLTDLVNDIDYKELRDGQEMCQGQAATKHWNTGMQSSPDKLVAVKVTWQRQQLKCRNRYQKECEEKHCIGHMVVCISQTRVEGQFVVRGAPWQFIYCMVRGNSIDRLM